MSVCCAHTRTSLSTLWPGGASIKSFHQVHQVQVRYIRTVPDKTKQPHIHHNIRSVLIYHHYTSATPVRKRVFVGKAYLSYVTFERQCMEFYEVFWNFNVIFLDFNVPQYNLYMLLNTYF